MREMIAKDPGKVRTGELQHLALILADWWTRPDAERMMRWDRAAYREQVLRLWQLGLDDSGKSIEKLLSALCLQQRHLKAEYERLFVGPAAIPCPPYEAVWRTDRPKQEQGTVIGKSTMQVKQLYRELGLCLRADQCELPDHIAIELEALACAWSIGDSTRADCLISQLRDWLPPFCAAVASNSRMKFYRDLAEATWEFFSSGKILSCERPPQAARGEPRPIHTEL